REAEPRPAATRTRTGAQRIRCTQLILSSRAHNGAVHQTSAPEQAKLSPRRHRLEAEHARLARSRAKAGKARGAAARRAMHIRGRRKIREARRFDRVLGWKVSRLGRDMREVISAVTNLRISGVTVIPVKSQTEQLIPQ